MTKTNQTNRDEAQLIYVTYVSLEFEQKTWTK